MYQPASMNTDLIEDIKIFLPKLIGSSHAVSGMLYTSISEEVWLQFADLVEGMNDLYKALLIIRDEVGMKEEKNTNHFLIEQSLLSLSTKFQKLNEYMDEEDYIGAADQLKYELIPFFKQLKGQLGMDREGKKEMFKQNMNYFQRKFPDLYIRFASRDFDEQDYTAYYTKNGFSNMFAIQQQKYIYSQFDPQKEASRWVENIKEKVQDKQAVFMYGFGLGYHALEYAKIYPNHNLIIYEPDEQMMATALQIINFENILDKLNITHFVAGLNKTERTDLLYEFIKYENGAAEVLLLPLYNKINVQAKDAFIAEVHTAVLNYANFVIIHERLAIDWTRNSMYNLPVNLRTPSITGLENMLKDKTVIIVGAGPSLEVDIEHLKSIRSHAVIISAGSTTQTLLYHGIKPHLIVSMDGAEANYNAFKDIDISDIPMLYCPTVHYRILEKASKHLVHAFVGSDWTTEYLMDLQKDDSVLTSTHSVTGTAIQAALYMGSKRIVFAGQDMSYPDDRIYSSGIKHVDNSYNQKMIQDATDQVENVQGTFNRINDIMKLMLIDIEDLIAGHPEVEFINTTANGAKIKHTTWKPMKDILIELGTQVISNHLFVELIDKLPKYNQNRINYTKQKIALFPKDLMKSMERLKQIQKNLLLLNDEENHHAAKSIKIIKAIDQDWEQVVNSLTFKGLFVKSCNNELNVFEKELRILTQATSIEQKQFYIYYMQPLVEKMLSQEEVLREIVSETTRRMEERG